MATDFTYSDADIVRIFCNHLTKAERNNVILFFLAYSALLIIRSDLVDLLDAIPASRLVKRFLRILSAAIALLGASPDEVLARLFKGKMLRAVIACVDVELNRPT